jgi:adenosylcobinamide-GDP ribazoletransferase
MKSGTAGPAGVVAVVVVLGVQGAALASLVGGTRQAVLAAVLVCASRCALTLTCSRPVPAARADGLGVTYCGTVPLPLAAATWLLAATAIGALAEEWWRGPLAVAVAVLVVAVLVRRAVTRFGGVTGDVFGAAIELALAALLVVAAA